VEEVLSVILGQCGVKWQQKTPSTEGLLTPHSRASGVQGVEHL
jgi:hypothetical protein